MLVLLAALLQSAPVTPVAPRPAAPAASAAQRPIEKPYMVDVEVTAGGDQLWRGQLRLGAGMASFDRRVRESLPASCGGTPGPASYTSNVFSVMLSSFPTRAGGSRQMYHVNWEHPAQKCGSGNVTTTVRLNGNADLAPGQSITVDGDGGLKLKLTRLATAD